MNKIYDNNIHGETVQSINDTCTIYRIPSSHFSIGHNKKVRERLNMNLSQEI